MHRSGRGVSVGLVIDAQANSGEINQRSASDEFRLILALESRTAPIYRSLSDFVEIVRSNTGSPFQNRSKTSLGGDPPSKESDGPFVGDGDCFRIRRVRKADMPRPARCTAPRSSASLVSRCTKLGDYGKKASFAALNWETQPRELYLNMRPAIMFTLRDLSSKK